MLYLSSCSIVKNEDNYIDDFVKIHRKLGVESFLFFDRSVNPLSERYKNEPDIKVIHFPEPNRHAHAWREGVKYFQGKSKWVQFIDIDQVVVPMQTNDIKIMLQDYERFPSLGLNWHSFGANGRDVEPEADISTYEAYTRRADANAGINTHIQSIVQVEFATHDTWHDPHHPILKPGLSQVNENKIAFSGPWNNPISQNIGFIAHYYTRSRAYWAAKVAKMRADTGTQGGSVADFDHHQTYMNVIEDLKVNNLWQSFK